MAILTTAELAIYAPGISATNAAALISQAQIVAEGPQGANRPLEKASVTEILKVRSGSIQSIYLSRFPVDSTASKTFKVRLGNVRTRYHRAVPLGDWRTLSEDEYILDFTGKLSLNVGQSTFFRNYDVGQNRVVATEVEATYTGGLDFTESTSEIESIKYALGQLIEFQQSDGYRSDKKVIDIDKRIRVENFDRTAPGKTRIPQDLLTIFQKYRVRKF